MSEKRLDKNTYANMIAMLESPDIENRNLAFECINNTDLKTNLIYLLLLMKKVNISRELWLEHASEKLKIVETITKNNISALSFENILDAMRTSNAFQDDYQFFMNEYAEYLKTLCFVEDIKILVK